MSAGKHKQPLPFSLSNTNTQTQAEHPLKSTDLLRLHHRGEVFLQLDDGPSHLHVSSNFLCVNLLLAEINFRIILQPQGLATSARVFLPDVILSSGPQKKNNPVKIQTVWINLICLCWLHAL